MKALAAVAAAALLAACTEAAQDKPEEVRVVRVITIGAADASRRVEYAGEVRARHETRLAFRVGGKITERRVEVGSVVKPGQLVARLDASDLALGAASAAAQVASIESERNLAQAELKRYADLRAKNFISQAEYDRRASAFATASSRLEAARAQQRQAANQAGYASLVADTAGIITAIEAEAGQVVSPGQTVARLARPGEREIAFAVPESQRDLVEQAGELAVSLGARPGKTWKGKLRELSPAADPVTRTYLARATILEAGEDIELGMSARVAVSAGSAARRIEVPIAALHSRGEAPQVFVVGADGTVQPRAIKTAGVTGERVIVESGLAPGDVVVAAGAQLLRPGQRVKVLAGK
jgi:multidrug efflux system membrane fusion protein